MNRYISNIEEARKVYIEELLKLNPEQQGDEIDKLYEITEKPRKESRAENECSFIKNHSDNGITAKDIQVEEWVEDDGDDENGKPIFSSNYSFYVIKNGEHLCTYYDLDKLFPNPNKEEDGESEDAYQRIRKFIPPHFSEAMENSYEYVGDLPINEFLAKCGIKPVIPNVNPDTQHIKQGVPREY